MITLRHTNSILSLIVLIAVLIPGALFASDVPLSEVPVRFAVIGDRTGGPLDPICWEIIREIDRLKPEFVITVGDMIEGSTLDTAQYGEDWREYREHLSVLDGPVYFVPGNHESQTEDMAALFKQYFNDPYFSVDHRGLHIIILNNGYFESADQWPQEQIDWLRADLAEHAGAEQTIVCFHKPFWRETVVRGNPAPLHDIFKEYGVDAVFTGHYHRYFSGMVDGIRYTGFGTSGGGASGDTSLIAQHFGWVTVTADDIHVTPIRYGSVLPWDLIPVDADIASRKFDYRGVEFVKAANVNEELRVPGDTARVLIRNFNLERGLVDTARWTVPNGWTVQPSKMPLHIPPGDSAVVEFTVMGEGSLYPRPSLQIAFPWTDERPFNVTRDLCIRRPAAASLVQQEIKLDGTLDEACWSHPHEKFLAFSGEIAELEPTAFYFAYDSEYFYFGASCEGVSPDSLKAEVSERDGTVYSDDCVGFFIQPDPQIDTAFQFYINPAGAIYDVTIYQHPEGFYDGTVDWNGAWQTATRTSGNGWSVEARIRWSDLSVDGDIPEYSLMNCRRKQQHPYVSGCWQPTWQYDPSGWGKLEFTR